MPASESTALDDTGLACYGKSYLRSVLHSREAPPMNKATAGLQPPLPLCNHIRNSVTTSGKDKPPQKSSAIWGKEKKKKRKSKSRVSPRLKERRGAHPLLPSPQSIFHTHQTITSSLLPHKPVLASTWGKHPTWLYAFQKSALKVLSLPVPHAKDDAFCLIIGLALTNFQKLCS